MFVAIDRVSKFAFAELHERATRRIAADFLRRLLEQCRTGFTPCSPTTGYLRSQGDRASLIWPYWSASTDTTRSPSGSTVAESHADHSHTGSSRAACPDTASQSVEIQVEGPSIIYEVASASTARGEGIRPPGLVASGKRR